MIAAKDEELRRISSVLLVSDYDMIRLKVMNQVELVHREQVERLNVEIHKKDVEIAELKSRSSTLSSKYEYLVVEMKRKQEQAVDKQEGLIRKNMSEIKQLYQSMQRDKVDAEKWRKKYELL